MIKCFNVLWLLACLSLLSCHKKEEIATYTVIRKNFENILFVDGIVDPFRSSNIVTRNGGTVASLLEEGTLVEEGDVVVVLENSDLENYYNEQLTNLENAKLNLAKLKANLAMEYAMLDAEVKGNDLETQIANLDSLQLQYYSPSQKKIRALELKQVAIAREKFQKKLDALTIIQKTDLRKQEIQIQQLTAQVKSIKDRLDGLVLKAPKKGLVLRGFNWGTGKKFEVGDQCWNNAVLASVPEMDKMKVVIEAYETEYKYINMNDSVFFVFDALPNNIAWGKIINKMPVGKELEKGSKVKLFTIEAIIDSTQTIPDPGFTVQCYTYLKAIEDTLVIPQIAIFEQDSLKVVYVDSQKGYEMRQVELGESSPKETIVTKGLNYGEQIALRQPLGSSILAKTLLPAQESNIVKNDSIVAPNNIEHKK